MWQWVLRRLTWIVIAKAGTVADITVGDFLELHQAGRVMRRRSSIIGHCDKGHGFALGACSRAHRRRRSPIVGAGAHRGIQ